MLVRLNYRGGGEILLCFAIPIIYATWCVMGLFVVGIPIEELIYAGLAGMSGTVLYPLLTRREFVRI